jgi:ParB family chromosome partitioning protein
MTTTTVNAAAAGRKLVQKTIPTSRIDRDPGQPRQLFDEDKLNELAGSMRELGQLQPITVRYVPATKRYVIVMGERRWRAAQKAGLAEMHCLVIHGVPAEGDRETFAKAVAENVGRVDMTPLEEGKAFAKLMDHGYTMEQVAAVCGKSLNFVELRLDLLKLNDQMREALVKGHIPVGLAWYVACLSHDNQARFLARYIAGEFPTIRDAEAFAQACRRAEENHNAQGAFFVIADPATTSGAGHGQDGMFDVDEDRREQIRADRARLAGKIERLSAAGAILAEIAAMDPDDLAVLLAGAHGGLTGQRMRITHIKDVAAKAETAVRKAQAAAAVRAGAVQVNAADA